MGKPLITFQHYTAYKDAIQSVCYLEKLRGNDLENLNIWRDIINGNKKPLYASDQALTKIEVGIIIYIYIGLYTRSSERVSDFTVDLLGQRSRRCCDSVNLTRNCCCV